MEIKTLKNKHVAIHVDMPTAGVRSLMGDLETSDLPIAEVRLSRKAHGVHHVALHIPATATLHAIQKIYAHKT